MNDYPNLNPARNLLLNFIMQERTINFDFPPGANASRQDTERYLGIDITQHRRTYSVGIMHSSVHLSWFRLTRWQYAFDDGLLATASVSDIESLIYTNF